MTRAGAMVSGFVVQPDVLDAVRTLAHTSALVPVVLSERHIDVLSHHRLGVLKDAKKNFERGRGAQKFLAPRLKRFGRTTGSQLPTNISQARGESFAVERDGVLEGLEEGGSQNSNEPMAIPIAPRFRRNPKKFREMLEANRFVVVGRRGLLIDPDDRKQGERTEIAGVLTKRITRRPRLGFMRRWDQNRPKAEAKYESDLEKLTTEAGRGQLRSNIARGRVTRALTPQIAKASLEAGEREYQRFFNANPNNVPGARAAKRQAQRAVRRDLMQRAQGAAGGLS
ncbi:MAG: hypothetical protein NCW75_05560 [Phycisphaera sp.]|nr:MAG: hypothetical protein NCW75_05560 [Phycisphaera sp.]